MSLVFHPLATAGLLAGAVAFALAGLVLFTAPGRTRNRRLALVLFLEGVTDVFGGGLVLMAEPYALAFAAQATAFVAFGVLSVAYLWFLATLPSPVTRPLATPAASVALVAAMLLVGGSLLARTDLVLGGMEPGASSPWRFAPGPWTLSALILPSVPVLLFGLVAAVSMWRGSPAGSAARRQGAYYAVAFAIRDVGWLVFMLALFVLGAGPAATWFFNATLLVSYSVLAYGILRTQLLEIDLRLKWTLSRSTVLAAFVAAFFVASESAALLLGESLGPYLGILGAGLLLFALAPLQRVADRMADAALPAVHDSEAYRTVRKRDVYRAALEEALADGSLSPKDRAVLAALQDQLGITARDAVEMEAREGEAMRLRTYAGRRR